MLGNRLLPMLVLIAALGACAGGETEKPTNEASGEPKAASDVLALSAAELSRLGVEFATIEAAQHMPIATVPGSLAPPPNARVAVAAVIPGVVTRTLVVEGDTVRVGQPLAVIAARELITLGAGIEQAAARVEVARASDRRIGQLASEGVIAGARADEARAALREAEAELNEQRRIVRLVNGTPGQGSYTLTAPIAGKITTASIQTGSPISDSTAAYVIDAASQYELTAQLPERLLGQVHPGMSVRLPGDVKGEITSVGTVLDPQTRSATLRARIPPGPGVVSGRSLPVTVLAPAAEGAALVPAGAVLDVNGKPSLFVRTAQGLAVRPVTVGDQADGSVVIRSGVRAGEQVVIVGMSELKAIAGQE
jgi:cobalt-zinc-cadmium efflux system membrane fusion protein